MSNGPNRFLLPNLTSDEKEIQKQAEKYIRESKARDEIVRISQRPLSVWDRFRDITDVMFGTSLITPTQPVGFSAEAAGSRSYWGLRPEGPGPGQRAERELDENLAAQQALLDAGVPEDDPRMLALTGQFSQVEPHGQLRDGFRFGGMGLTERTTAFQQLPGLTQGVAAFGIDPTAFWGGMGALGQTASLAGSGIDAVRGLRAFGGAAPRFANLPVRDWANTAAAARTARRAEQTPQEAQRGLSIRAAATGDPRFGTPGRVPAGAAGPPHPTELLLADDAQIPQFPPQRFSRLAEQSPVPPRQGVGRKVTTPAQDLNAFFRPEPLRQPSLTRAQRAERARERVRAEADLRSRLGREPLPQEVDEVVDATRFPFGGTPRTPLLAADAAASRRAADVVPAADVPPSARGAEVLSRDEARNLPSIRATREQLWVPTAERMVRDVGTENPQEFVDVFVREFDLPPIRVVNEPHLGIGRSQPYMRHELGGTAAVMSDGSLQIGLPRGADVSEQLVFLRHEIQHHIDKHVHGFDIHRPHPFDESGEIVSGHHRPPFDAFDVDFPQAYLAGEVDVFGRQLDGVPPRAATPADVPPAARVADDAPVTPAAAADDAPTTAATTGRVAEGAGGGKPPDEPPVGAGGLDPEGNIEHGSPVSRKVEDALSPRIDTFIDRIRKFLSASNWYDRNHPLKLLERQTGIPVHQMAQVVPGAIGAGEDIIRRLYKPVLQNLKEQDIPFLEQYMTLMRMEDILKNAPKGKVPKLPGKIQGADGVLQEQRLLRAEIGNEAYEALEKVGRDLWKLHDEQVLQPLRNEGIISPEAYAALIADHPHYIPFQRADFTGNLSNVLNKRGDANMSTSGFKKLTVDGSERDLDNPLDRLVAEPIKSRDIIARNKAASGMVDALSELQSSTGNELVRITSPKEFLGKAAELTPDFKPADPNVVWETVFFYKEGVRYTAEVPAEWAAVAKGLGSEMDNIVLTGLRRLSNPIRMGATTYDPMFLVANMMRDVVSIFFREGVVPFGIDYFSGMIAAITKNQLFSDAAASHALMSGIIENMRTTSGAASAATRSAMRGAVPLSRPSDLLLLIPRLIAEANQTVERGARLAVYRKLSRELDITELGLATRVRDSSVDFAKAGDMMRVANQVVPFLNAAVQGGANFARGVRKNPKRAAVFGAMLMTPSLILRANNVRFESNELIPDHEYVRNWIFQFGEEIDSEGNLVPKYFRIPKGEIAGVFSLPIEMGFNIARQTNDRSFVEHLLGAARDTVNTLSPIEVPLVGRGNVDPFTSVPIVSTVRGVTTNLNPYTGNPIVPRRESKLFPEQQFGPDNTAIAVELGQKFNVSPRLIDFAIRDYTAGAGELATWAGSLALRAVGWTPPTRFGEGIAEPERTPWQQATRLPGGRRFLGSRNNRLDQIGWELFDRTVDETNREFNKIPGVFASGVRLGEVTNEVTIRGVEYEVSPSQRADHQQIMGGIVIQGMEIYVAENLPRVKGDENKKDAMGTVLLKLKSRARQQFVRKIAQELIGQRAQQAQTAPAGPPPPSGAAFAPPVMSVGGRTSNRAAFAPPVISVTP